MATLDDFIEFNVFEDMRKEQEAHQTTEYPYQKQYWEDKEEKSSYWDDDDSSSKDNY